MLKELRTQHRSVIQMSFNGFTNNEIAEKLDMTPSTVSIIIRSPLGQAYLNGLHDRMKESTLDVRKKLVGLNKAALDTFEKFLDTKRNAKVPYNVQYSTAKDILDRNGYKAPDKLNIDMTMQTKSDKELDAEILAMEEAIKRTQGPRLEPSVIPEISKPIGAQQNVDEDPINYDISSQAAGPKIQNESAPKKVLHNESSPPCDNSLADQSILDNTDFDPFHNISDDQ